MFEEQSRVLSKIAPVDRALDAVGWASPYSRSGWVIDAQPYATRGTVGRPRPHGGKTEQFSAAVFTQKYHCMHAEFDLSLPERFGRRLTRDQPNLRFYWTREFGFRESSIHGAHNIDAGLRAFARGHHDYPAPWYLMRSAGRLLKRGWDAAGRWVGN